MNIFAIFVVVYLAPEDTQDIELVNSAQVVTTSRIERTFHQRSFDDDFGVVPKPLGGIKDWNQDEDEDEEEEDDDEEAELESEFEVELELEGGGSFCHLHKGLTCNGTNHRSKNLYVVRCLAEFQAQYSGGYEIARVFGPSALISLLPCRHSALESCSRRKTPLLEQCSIQARFSHGMLSGKSVKCVW